jgi:O-antigen/teichoic acid export membrane protein
MKESENTYSQLKMRILSGALWSSFGGVVSRGALLVSFIFVARILGDERYGELAIIRSTANMLVLFAGFGLGVTATKFIAEYKDVDKEKVAKVITMSSVFAYTISSAVAIATFLLIPWLATNTINSPHLIDELRISIIILWAAAINGAQNGVLIGFEEFKTVANIQAFVGVFSFFSLIIGASLYQVKGVVIALSLNSLFSCILSFISIRKIAVKSNIAIYSSRWRDEIKLLWKYSLPATLGGLMVAPVIWACNAMLINRTDGYSQMAIFDVANQWFMAILFIPSLAGRVVLPLLSNLVGEGDKDNYFKVLKLSIIANGSIALVVAGIVSVMAPIIMQGYGESFVSGYKVLIYLSCAAVLVSINNVVAQVISSQSKMWHGFFINMIWACSMVIFSWNLLNEKNGAEGLALAYLCSYAVHSLVQLIYVYKLMNEKKYKGFP